MCLSPCLWSCVHPPGVPSTPSPCVHVIVHAGQTWLPLGNRRQLSKTASLELDSISHPWSFTLLPSPASHSPGLLGKQITPSLLPSHTHPLSLILLSAADLPPSSLRRPTPSEGSFHRLPPVSHPLPPFPPQHSSPHLCSGPPSPVSHPPAHVRCTSRLRLLLSHHFFPQLWLHVAVFATKLHQQAVHACCFPFRSHLLSYMAPVKLLPLLPQNHLSGGQR